MTGTGDDTLTPNVQDVLDIVTSMTPSGNTFSEKPALLIGVIPETL